MKLPSGMTTEQLREHVESEIAKGVAGNATLVRSVDLLALLVAMDLRERLDYDVKLLANFAYFRCTQSTDTEAHHNVELTEAAQRVLRHEPRPDMMKAPS